MNAIELKDFHIIGLSGDAEVVIAPSVSGFIGGDAVCGVLATGLHKSSEPCLLMDLGTNGEMALNYRGRYSPPLQVRAGLCILSDRFRYEGDYRRYRFCKELTMRSNIHYSVIGGVDPKAYAEQAPHLLYPL